MKSPFLENRSRHKIKQAHSGKCLYVYDKAATDYSWWDLQKRQGNYMISVLKENSKATFVESIPFDAADLINTGIEGYSRYETNDITFSLIDYRDPEQGNFTVL